MRFVARTALVVALLSATVTATPSASAAEHLTPRPPAGAPSAAVTETQPVAAWRLDDRNGSAYAAQWAGIFRGLPGPGVRFGDEGPDGRTPGTAHFDGGYFSYVNTDAGAVDTRQAFTAGVWVRPDDTGRDMTAINQAGISTVPNFSLGTTTDDAGKPAFAFTLPSADGGRTVVTGGTPQAGEWAYLAGVYDPANGTARLYVDGAQAAAGDAAVPEDTVLWNFVMGRDGNDRSKQWEGYLADVRLWDSVIDPAELAELGRRKPRLRAYWPLEGAEDWGDGQPVFPEVNHRAHFLAGGDAHVITDDALAGGGSVSLDGDGDFLESDIPPFDTSRSWAVSAKVRLHGTPDRDMAVLSQIGWQADAFTLRYRAADRTWQAVLAHADEPDATTTRIGAPARGGIQTLLLQYDERAGNVQLWIDGTLAGSAPYAAADAWEAARYLQAGRDSAADGVGAHYLDGDIDEVHTWAGVLSQGEINAL
ncbi:concanavalin A-like lectin/glucanase superfamily protein [Streptomyces sp. 840.1]|uniref:LamG domain-containing protein n=1 Tax=Streptomyces sp. 840.1 TaxID=2485152 RepID=UPI000FA04BB9|nr:LamG domain-containing protein [Streptomyces sp. 840.1]ROQ70087.1 concanavalin A-like lectin/glucanase superfamily protein [Streptomyces sp. 840.1]